MKQERPPLETWEFFQFIKKAFGQTYLNKLFSISSTQIKRWARNPRLATGDKASNNPIDHYEMILKDLMEDEELRHIARAIISRQADIVGCKMVEKTIAISNKKTITEECLNDLPAIVEYHRVLIDVNSTPEMVKYAWHEAEKELSQNYNIWIQQRGLLT